MIDNVLITGTELNKYGGGTNLADKAKALLNQQKEAWEMLREGYESLLSVEVKNFEFDNFQVKVQFNPGRIKSSSAKVDKKSIKERKCFLCMENLPGEQKGILFRNDYLILVNPFPIFPEHFTVPKIDHFPQRIDSSFDALLELSREIGKYYTLFYNGPKCGASAPDHMHFQAGNKHFMPIDDEYRDLKSSSILNPLAGNNEIEIFAADNYLRKFISFESANKEELQKAFQAYYLVHQKLTGDEEPMMNILSFYDENKWRIIIFPRGKHRPDFYYSDDDSRILWSPAAVDLGGVCITPVEKDFKKITKDDIVEGFRQISAPNEYFEFIKKKIKEHYTETEPE